LETSDANISLQKYWVNDDVTKIQLRKDFGCMMAENIALSAEN